MIDFDSKMINFESKFTGLGSKMTRKYIFDKDIIFNFEIGILSVLYNL